MRLQMENLFPIRAALKTLILTFSLREKELSLPLGETDAKRQRGLERGFGDGPK